ncbi:MAG: hypothetical protein KW788_03545 [Candidatus Doudnabacteria bacterium]|nr:hypothetical protein [Candidatus Doudnabacteria bacterium]
MKKLFLVTIIVVAVCFGVVVLKFRSGSSQTPNHNSQDQSQSDTTGNSDTATGEPKKLVVSDTELAKLQSQGVVSADTKYYIKNTTPFPKIVDLETGTEYNFRPAGNYSKVTKLTWSGDGQTLAFIYTVPDADYTGASLLNTARIADVVNQSFPNSARVLAAAAKLDYVWLDGKRILFSELQNFDADKKFYRNASINIYNIQSEMFEYPLRQDVALENIYSITLSPGLRKFMYVQAKLDSSGVTFGQQYVVANLDGTTLSTSDSFNPNWNK